MPKTKAQKRLEAEERQAAYDALTVAQKWDRVNNSPGVSAKQTARLINAEERPLRVRFAPEPKEAPNG
jgi:hypothetical protein